MNPEFNKASVCEPLFVVATVLLSCTFEFFMLVGRYRGYWINCKRDGPGIQLNANGSIDQGMCVVAVLCVTVRVCLVSCDMVVTTLALQMEGG